MLGPGGKTLQGLAKHFKGHFYVLGRFSYAIQMFYRSLNVVGQGTTRDPADEQQKLISGDPQFAHFAEPAHVRIEVLAGEAHFQHFVNHHLRYRYCKWL